MIIADGELIEVHTEQLGRSVYLRPRTSDEHGWQDTFLKQYHVPPAEMPAPRVVLDLGANIGLTAAHYAAMWPDALVWMVEPNPDNMALARKNAPRCPPLLCAVALESGWHWLREGELSADAYTLARSDEDHTDCRDVYAISLALLIEIVGGDHGGVDFIKMDIEGSEWDILDPRRLGSLIEAPMVPYLLVEFHDEPRDGPVIVKRGIDVLEALGYEARHHEVHPQAVWAMKE